MNLNEDIKSINDWFKEELTFKPDIKVNNFVVTYGLKEEPDNNQYMRKFKKLDQVIAWRLVMDGLITWYSIGAE